MTKVHTKNQQAGSVILEALIAILIFSIGILALVGMQASAISNVADAKYRSTAGFLADEIIGTMWSTRIVDASAVAASNVIIAAPDATFACGSYGAGCSSTNGNAYTRAWMASGVAAELPNGQASIVINGGRVTVTVSWTPPKDAVTHRHVISTVID